MELHGDPCHVDPNGPPWAMGPMGQAGRAGEQDRRSVWASRTGGRDRRDWAGWTASGRAAEDDKNKKGVTSSSDIKSHERAKKAKTTIHKKCLGTAR